MRTKPFRAAFVDQEKQINLEKGIIPFILTSKTVDRDSEVMLPDGGDITEFKDNPVFMWAHDISSPSIGRVLPETIKQTKQKMTGDVEFDLEDPFAAMVFNKYVKKHLNAGSIRFRPVTIGMDPVLPGQKGVTHLKWKLLEFSAVPVPANPQALAQIQKGLEDLGDDRAKEWNEVLKSFLGQEDTEHDPEGYVSFVNAKATEEEPEEEPEPKVEKYEVQNVVKLDDVRTIIKEVVREIMGKKAVPFMACTVVSDDEDVAFSPIYVKEMYGWWDSGEGKFLHHANRSGEIVTSWPLVAKAMIELFKDEEISEDDRCEVFDHLARHYKECDKEPPEFKEYKEEEIQEMEKEIDVPEEFELSQDDMDRIIAEASSQISAPEHEEQHTE